MDEHRLRLRYENGLTMSLAEYPVRRVNKRIRQVLLSGSAHEKTEAVNGLLRDLDTLRDNILEQQLRHKKLQQLNLVESNELQNQEKARLESELKEKTEVYEKLTGKVPKSQAKTETNRSSLRPVAVCDNEVTEIEKQEKELDERILQQCQGLLKWKELGLMIEDFLSTMTTSRRSIEHPAGDLTTEELEPKIKKWIHLSVSNVHSMT